VFIEAKDDGDGGNNWSYKTCKAPVKSSPPTNQHLNFLQAGCPSCRPTNSVKALKGKISHSMDMFTTMACSNTINSSINAANEQKMLKLDDPQHSFIHQKCPTPKLLFCSQRDTATK